MDLSYWQIKLEEHFQTLRELRTTGIGDHPLFALEHGLTEAEVATLSEDVRTHIGKAAPSWQHRLPWTVYATEVGYHYSGDQYWQTFEEQTPGWVIYGDRYWLRRCFLDFQKQYGGAEPTGAWAHHFSIICWPITHAILPQDLQWQLAKLLYELQDLTDSSLLESPSALGELLAIRSWRASSRFQELAQEPLLIGQIATALLLYSEHDVSPLILPSTLERIVKDLENEQEARRWMQSAREKAQSRLQPLPNRGQSFGKAKSAHEWSIHDQGQSLTHATTCWWCGKSVFFYRDENGGCVLFDSLGAPWPIHSCWEDHMSQQKICSSIESELADLGYDGTFYEIEYEKIIRPVKKKFQVSVSGYVCDNYYFYEEIDRKFLRSHKRASTLNLIVLEVFDGNQIYPFLIPEKNAEEYPVYSIVDIKGTWLRNNKEWYLLTTSIKREDPSAISTNFSHLLTAEGVCCSCGRSIKTGISWGLDNEGFLECHYCGEMRGQYTRKEFINSILSISEYQANSSNEKTEQLIPKFSRGKSDDWLDDLIAWADENEIPEDEFPRDKQKILKLTELNLEDNQLYSLPDSIGHLSNLTMLSLEYNQLASLPESIGQLSNLTELYLSRNHLACLPESIGSLSKLTVLNIQGNHLTSISDSIGHLSKLTWLGLKYNQLASLPESIGQLSNLTELYLSNNQLTNLPESIGQLSNLTWLHLSNNLLTRLPESIGQLSNLTELYLSRNHLTCLPESIGNLINLTTLNLYSNNLAKLPLSFNSLAKLKNLDIQYSQLKSYRQN